MASGRLVGQRPDCHTFLCKFWRFQMAVSQWKLAWLTPNLGILWISVSSFWLCELIVANPIIYRLVPRPSRFETRQCSVLSIMSIAVFTHNYTRFWCYVHRRINIHLPILKCYHNGLLSRRTRLLVIKDGLIWYQTKVRSIKKWYQTKVRSIKKSFRGDNCFECLHLSKTILVRRANSTGSPPLTAYFP